MFLLNILCLVFTRLGQSQWLLYKYLFLSHCCPKDRQMGLTVGRLAAAGLLRRVTTLPSFLEEMESEDESTLYGLSSHSPSSRLARQSIPPSSARQL